MATDYLMVKNWSEYQAVQYRNPPWIKLHTDMLHSKRWIKASDSEKLAMVCCLLVSAKKDLKIPNDPEHIQGMCYLKETPDIQPLIDNGFLIPFCEQVSTGVNKSKQPETDVGNPVPRVRVRERVRGREINSKDKKDRDALKQRAWSSFILELKKKLKTEEPDAPDVVDSYLDAFLEGMDDYHERKGGTFTDTRKQYVANQLSKYSATIALEALEIFIDKHIGDKPHKYLCGIAKRMSTLSGAERDKDMIKHRDNYPDGILGGM